MFLPDANVLSETEKGEAGSMAVRDWLEAVSRSHLHASVISLGEIRKGIETLRPGSPTRQTAWNSG